MISISTLFFQILILCLYIVPGFLMRKLKFAGDERIEKGFPKGLSNFVLYIAQPAMLISPYIRDFDIGILKNMGFTFFLSFVTHAIFLCVAFFLIRPKVKGQPDKTERVVRIAIVFSNCGYMGIPLIEQLLGPEAAIYATVYNIAFQMVEWSFGFYMSTGDKKYISVKKMFINPAMISIYVGLAIFFTPINTFIPEFLITFINGMKGLVLPLSLTVVGFHLGGAHLRRLFNNINVWKTVIFRGIVCPVLVFIAFKLIILIGGPLFSDKTAFIVSFICAATPCATLSSMLAEKFDLDTSLSGKCVPISTILALATMPLTALLLYLL